MTFRRSNVATSNGYGCLSAPESRRIVTSKLKHQEKPAQAHSNADIAMFSSSERAVLHSRPNNRLRNLIDVGAEWGVTWSLPSYEWRRW